MGVPPGAVWLDARGTQSADHGERGIARYIAEQTRALLETAPTQIAGIGLDPAAPIPGSLQTLQQSGKLKLQSSSLPADASPAIYHVMSPFEPRLELDDVLPPWVRERECRLVVTLYDLIPLVMRDDYLGDSNWAHWGTVWMARLGLIRAADQVLTISRRTAEDAADHLGIAKERITVVESGVSENLASLVGSREEAESILKAQIRRVRRGFLLYVGGDDPRKNLEGMIRAYAQLSPELRSKHQLVIVCKLPLTRRMQLARFARRMGIRGGELALTGFVPNRGLAALYRGCELFVFPSLYEGAGLPILEAMSCGAPVATSNGSSIPEILGDLEATFDPTDPADIARCLDDVLTDPGLIDSLRKRSSDRVRLFTWHRVAKRTLVGYERALAAEPRLNVVHGASGPDHGNQRAGR